MKHQTIDQQSLNDPNMRDREVKVLTAGTQAWSLDSKLGLSYLDAHTHLRPADLPGLSSLLEETGLHLIASSTRREDYQIFVHSQLSWTFGIHPWSASMDAVEKARDLLKAVPIIGEIGMDNVWCDRPLDVQEEVFRAQLAIAEKQQKLVVLHTKGMEAEISKILEDYDVPFMIHWYAGPPDLPFVERARFITLGPEPGDLSTVVKPEQLLLETDGLESLTWLDGRERAIADWIPALEASFERFLKVRSINAPAEREAWRTQLSRNSLSLWTASRVKPISS